MSSMGTQDMAKAQVVSVPTLGTTNLASISGIDWASKLKVIKIYACW